MRKAQIAEFILSLFTSRERAASTVGDLIENAAARGVWWFWWDISRTAFSLLWNSFRAEPLFMVGIGLRGMMLNVFLMLASLLCIIVCISPIAMFLGFLEGSDSVTSSAASDPSLGVLRFRLMFYLLGLIPAFAVQFQTGRWIARRARGREMAACVSFLIAQAVIMRIVGEIVSRWHWLDNLPKSSSSVPVPDIGTSDASIVIIMFLSLIVLFAGAIRVRSRSLNQANALS